MPRARLEYDDSGTTFYYFLLSFYALILLPITYFLYPRKAKAEEEKGLVCQCEGCLTKRARLEAEKPKRWVATTLRYAVLLLLWLLLFVMLYKVLSADKDYEEYDPFEILQIDPGASMSAIRKQYRKLSKVFHPDKQGGDQEMFMKIAKAYEALTDEVSRENWEKYGNPDGPQAASFGIALPSWIVEKQNSLWVLAAYMGVFMVALPILVGVWWYRSIKYGSSNVLIQTTQLFAFFLNKSKSIPLKRVVMFLTAAMEFNHEVSQLLPSRPSDDVELSKLIASRTLPHVHMQTKERPLCLPYAVKARILVNAHIEHVPLHSSFLEADQRVVLKKCPQLVQEMVNILSQLWYMHRSRGARPPSLDLFEEVMKVGGAVVQAMWVTGNSPLLQLPHLSPALLRHFKTKKRNITTIQQFTALAPVERRGLVRTLSDEEYSDVMAVCANFPIVSIQAETQVVDDENTKRITAKSLVTLSVRLERQSLQEAGILVMGSSQDALPSHQGDGVETVGAGEGEERDEGGEERSNGPVVVRKAKGSASAKKKGKGQSKLRRRTVNPKKLKKGNRSRSGAVAEEEEPGSEEDEGSKPGGTSGGGHGSDQEEESDGGDQEERQGGEEEQWNKLQQSIKKHSKKTLEQKVTDSPPVHAPFFPEEKLEVWWLYVADRKKKEMVCLPVKVAGLMREHTTDLQFAAPERPGMYRYSVILRSDSYLDLSFSQDIKLNVGAQQEVSGRDQWAELEKEEEEEEMIEESSEGEISDSGEESD